MQHAEGDRVVRRYERFAMVPVQLLRSPSVSSHAVRVFLLLDSYANWTTQEAFPAQARLAEDMGVSLATVKRAIAEVAAAGYLEVQQRTDARGMRVGAIYTLFDAPQARDEETARVRVDEASDPATGAPPGNATPVTSGQLTGELSGGVTAVMSGQLTGEPSDSSQVSRQNETLKTIKTDNDKLRNACAGAHEGEAVVSSAAPAGRTADTPRAGGAGEAGACAAPTDPALLGDLLGRVPGLDADTALEWIASHGPERVRERLAWLEAEMGRKTIATPAGWLRTALLKPWAQPPRSYRAAQLQAEHSRLRAEAEALAIRQRTDREAELAEDAQRVRAAVAWFGALPPIERARLDAEIRAGLAQSFAARAKGIPELPEVLAASDLAARLWRDRLVSAHLETGVTSAVRERGPDGRHAEASRQAIATRPIHPEAAQGHTRSLQEEVVSA